jgi:predicted transcriptional regulator of viral defense system
MPDKDHPAPDRKLARLAARQHGVVSLDQLRDLGLTRDAVSWRAQSGHLHRIRRGVYAVGHRRLTQRARWLAAVLACGPSAVLSHRAALALWALRPAPAGPIDVTAVARGRRPGEGIRLHCVRSLDPVDRLTIDAIPVTTVTRTLLDYAEVAKRQEPRRRSRPPTPGNCSTSTASTRCSRTGPAGAARGRCRRLSVSSRARPRGRGRSSSVSSLR